ncbi:sodium:proton antiporter [soil metagenome]
MEFALFGVVGVITIVAAGVFGPKLGVAAPLLLILIGIGFSFLYGGKVEVPHEIILAGLLPPILYSAAITVPVVDFRRNFSSISALSVVLVLVTAFVTGYVLYRIFPDLSLAGGIAIGAIISPTDAVAATALGKKLGLPPRLVLILEGESLVNDATALVLLRSAVAATAGAVSFWGVAGDFAKAVVIAIAVGLLVGWVTVWVRSKLHNPMLDTVISLAVPFIAFIPAEKLNASGVLAVVAAGLYSGHQGARHFSAQARISERLNWRTAQFVIENGVFLLMGFQIRTLIDNVQGDAATIGAVWLGLLMALLLIVIRFVFIGPLLLLLRRGQSREEARQPRIAATIERLRDLAPGRRAQRNRADRAERFYERRKVDLEQLKAEGLGWRGGVVLGWAGMRGVVTLAAAQSLPDEKDFPYRSELVLLAFVVAVATLLVQGSTLPLLIRATRIRGTDRVADRRELATLLDEMSEAGVTVLEDPEFSLIGDKPIEEAVIERVRSDTLLSAESAWERAENGTDEKGVAQSPHQQYRALRREVLQAERAALLEARSSGTYPSRILSRAQSMLDLEETRLEQMDNPSGS